MANEGASSSSRLGQVCLQVLKNEGPRSFYLGLTPSLTRSVVYGGLRLGLYEPSKHACDLAFCSTNVLVKIASGAFSGAFATALTNPMEVLKVRLQMNPDKRKGGPILELRRTISEEGVRGLWKGVGPAMVRAASLTASQLASYDETKNYMEEACVGVLILLDYAGGSATYYKLSCTGRFVSFLLTMISSNFFNHFETVESWIATKNLNPRKLIPAMMRYSSEPHAKNETHEVIKYLEYCVHRLHNEDPGIHNLLLSLYAKQEDDSALLRFLQCKFGKGQENGPDFFYDPKYALRLCLREKGMRACVHIYSMMSMHEEAVALALQVDPELAMTEADKVEDDEDLRKKLWLMIAKHVVEQEKRTKRENIRKAIAFLKETDGLLKIEDILPFLPDFAFHM